VGAEDRQGFTVGDVERGYGDELSSAGGDAQITASNAHFAAV
jgi:hypothetical protein